MPLGMAVVGTGRWGKQHARILSESRRARLRWICDASPAALAALSKRLDGCRTTENLDEVLSDPEVAAVVVAVPSPHHHSVARKVIESGRHCFVEKPLALTVRDAEDLRDLAAKHSRIVMVGHLLLYHPAYRFVADLVTSGKCGRVYYLHSRRTNLGVIRPDENAWWSLAPHDVSVAIDVFGGAPETVSASGGAWIQKGVEDTVFAVLKWADGRLAQVHVSWLDPHKKRELTVVSSEKMVVWDDMNAQEMVRVYDRGVDKKVDFQSYAEYVSIRSGDAWLPAISMQEPLQLELEHFVDSIEKGTVPRTSVQTGVDVVRVLAAGQRSLARNGAPEAV